MYDTYEFNVFIPQYILCRYVRNNSTVILIYLFLFLFISVVLLDTTTEPSLRWTTYPYGPDANAAGVSLKTL